MASVENIHVTEQTSDAKQSDREQDSIEVFEDDFDDSVLSFSESSSVPDDMMMYDLYDNSPTNQSDTKWFNSFLKRDGTTNIQANCVQFNNMKERPSLPNHKATVLGHDRKSQKLPQQPDVKKTYHGHPVDVEGERSVGRAKISTSNAGHCKSMSLVVNSPTKTVEDRSRWKFQQVKQMLEKTEKQLCEMTINWKNEQIKYGKTTCDFNYLMRTTEGLVVENDSLKQELKSIEDNHRIELLRQKHAWVQWKNAQEQEMAELEQKLKSMEENHRIELREQENAWVQWKNAREQEMAELEQKCRTYVQYYQQSEEVFKKKEENLMADITTLTHAENYQLACRLRVEKECRTYAQNCQQQGEVFKKKEENLMADITTLTHAENYQLACRLRMEKELKSMEENHRIELQEQKNVWAQWINAMDQKIAELDQELEKEKSSLSSAQVKCRNARKIKDDVLNTNNALEEQNQTLEAELGTVVAERDRLREQLADTRRSNGTLQQQIIQNFQAFEGREQEFRDFIDRLLSPPQPAEPVVQPRGPEVGNFNRQLPAESVDITVLSAERVSCDHVPD